MKIYDVEQGSQEWLKLRLGRPTASNFSRIITAKGRKLSKSADGYIDQLLGEQGALHMPARAPDYTRNSAIQWGVETEAEARRWFQMESGLKIAKVGFITTDDGRFGCSPDGLVIDTNGKTIGGLELKCPQPEAHMRWTRETACGHFPAEHIAQVHGCMVVTGLPCWWFVSYCPGLEPICHPVGPDMFTEELRVCLESFWLRYQQIRQLLGLQSKNDMVESEPFAAPEF